MSLMAILPIWPSFQTPGGGSFTHWRGFPIKIPLETLGVYQILTILYIDVGEQCYSSHHPILGCGPKVKTIRIPSTI